MVDLIFVFISICILSIAYYRLKKTRQFYKNKLQNLENIYKETQTVWGLRGQELEDLREKTKVSIGKTSDKDELEMLLLRLDLIDHWDKLTMCVEESCEVCEIKSKL